MHESGSHRPFGISIHALRKESDLKAEELSRQLMISIHALRKESDEGELTHDRTGVDFNPRSP